MKKLIMVIIAATITTGLLGTSVFADDAANEKKEEIKFRDYDWGTTRDEIIENEVTSSMVENKDYANVDNKLAILNQSIAGHDCGMVFVFNDKDELIRGQYLLDEQHSNEQQYYNDYMDLIEKITSLYGEDDLPTHELWYDDTYKDRPNKQGMAIITGDLQLGYSWSDKNGNTLNCMAYGDNYDCSIVIQYDSKTASETSQKNVDGL